MSCRLPIVFSGTAAAAAFLVTLPLSAQTQPLAAKPAYTSKARTFSVPRTPGGHPDFTGIWTNVTITPLERPKELAGKEFFTPQEAVAYQKQMVERRNKDQRERGTQRDVADAYNDFWWDSGTTVVKTLRTSIVVDPPDGRIPALTPQRRQELEERADAVRRRCEQPGCEPENSGLLGPADGPEDRPLMERCLAFGSGGPPMMPSAYNNNYQFVESAGYLDIDVEMAHDVRRIPLNGSAHLPAGIRQWMGDPRGHWEGDTLVVDTTNFTGKTTFRGSDKNLHLTERFSFLDPDTILYQFTVDDPTAFTRTWSGEIPMVRTKGPLFEYACNEGNIGLRDILTSARADERKAAGTPKQQ
ncbi:MAG TPA: hypothetical protein VJ732_09625 [Bryobacteraceae bacterium]|nr:hypothetical protein [Bryobacteraceae bacterium]